MKSTHLRWLCQNLDFLRVPLNATERAERQGNVPYWGANGVVDYVLIPGEAAHHNEMIAPTVTE